VIDLGERIENRFLDSEDTIVYTKFTYGGSNYQFGGSFLIRMGSHFGT